MAFIGNTNTTQGFIPAIDYFNGNGSTTAFTLSRPVASVAQVQAVVNNVAQNPSSAFTVSANTLTFTSAPLSGTNNIYVYYTSPITQVIAPGQGTVTTTSLTSSLTLTTPIVATTIGVGAATASASGAGVTFPATQSASSDANTLDDYEEGTWTPTIGGTATYYTQAGRYVKIGRIVLVNFQCEINVRGTGSTTIMTGLPFNPISAPTMAGCVGYFGNLAVNTYFLGFYANVNGQVQFIGQQGLDGTNEQPLAVFGNGTNIVGTLTYET